MRDLFVKEGQTVEDICTHYDSNYGDACAKFVEDNWDRYFDGLSSKQQQWVEKILDDLMK